MKKLNGWVLRQQLKRIFTPSMWIQCYRDDVRRDQKFDEEIRREMEEGKLIPSAAGLVAYRPNGDELWVGNYPFAYGYQYQTLVTSKTAAIKPRIGETTIPKVKDYLLGMAPCPSIMHTVWLLHFNHLEWWYFYSNAVERGITSPFEFNLNAPKHDPFAEETK